MAIIQVNLHYPALQVKNWKIWLVQSFTAHMPLLAATSASGVLIVSVPSIVDK